MENKKGTYTGVNYLVGGITVMLDNSRDNLLTDFGKATLTDRYLQPGESFQDLFARVAVNYASDSRHAQRVYDYISKLWFMPATPALSNGGTGRGMPISCFLNSVEDSLESIADVFNENLWLAARGGGIGTNWSDVREIGADVAGNGHTSGIVPFIHVQDSQTLGISQGSLRRGSSAAYLDVSHPEIEEFIEMRKPTGGDIHRKNLNVHHGVTIPDAFMEAVGSGSKWDLISPRTGKVVSTVDARELWQRILTARIETGEPYMIFIDEVNRSTSETASRLGLKVKQSNLCAEITLPTGRDHLGYTRTAVCCLSSLNLERYDEWVGNAVFMEDILLFLDNVMSEFIRKTEGVKGFENARYSAMRERSIGLGTMGFHGYLQSKGIPFESAMAQSFNMRAFGWIRATLDLKNLELGKRLGPCPDGVESGTNVRFSNMMAIAPTASISIIAGGASPGIEALSANAFAQKTLSGTFAVRNKHLDKVLRSKWDTDLCGAYAAEFTDVDEWMEHEWSRIAINGGSVQNNSLLSDNEKDTFKTAFEIDQRWVIDHAASRAQFVCQAQSVNIFLDPDVDKRDLHFLHFRAWQKGLKSLYYCRSKSKQRAEVVSNMSGEMPQARPDMPIKVDYDDECLSCQ